MRLFWILKHPNEITRQLSLPGFSLGMEKYNRRGNAAVGAVASRPSVPDVAGRQAGDHWPPLRWARKCIRRGGY